MIRLISLVLIIQVIGLTSSGHAQSIDGYTHTIDSLEKRYAEEILAHQKYMAYSEQACAEGYPNIAHLFKALAASEGIHARNFRTILSDLGSKQDPSLSKSEIDVASTSHNLKHAANVERDEIDREYPEILATIRPENHKEAITSVDYAWKAEQQHRELIVKIQKAAIKFFGLLVSRIEGRDTHYHVCQVCGSTLMEKTQHNCPICGNPMSQYRTIAAFPPTACPLPKSEEEDVLDFISR